MSPFLVCIIINCILNTPLAVTELHMKHNYASTIWNKSRYVSIRKKIVVTWEKMLTDVTKKIKIVVILPR